MRHLFTHSFSQRMFALVFAALIMLSGCASTNRITQDYRTGTDFHRYKTFSWHNYSSDISSADQITVQRAIEQTLTQQGLRKVNANADLLLDLNIIKRRNSGASTHVGVSIGLPLGNHGAIGLGTNQLLNNDNQMAGLIILDITVIETNQVIWRGSAEDVPMSYFFVRNQAQLNGILRDMVSQFPPTK